MDDLWSIALGAVQTLGKHYVPAMEQTAARLGAADWFGLLYTALMFDPEPLSASRLRMRNPYASVGFFNERLANAANGGFLVSCAEAEYEYCLTEQGRKAAIQIIEAAYGKMVELKPLPPADLERLAGLLFRLVQACLSAPVPPGKWCISHSRRCDPGEGANVVVQIDQYISDLAAYRDDAHLAAWQVHDMEGSAWEALTCLWRKEASTLDTLHQKLSRRGYTREEYRQALHDLIKRGWIKQEAGEFQVTNDGQEIRQAAEKVTDRYFYAPWACLSQAETEDLRDLLLRFRDGLS